VGAACKTQVTGGNLTEDPKAKAYYGTVGALYLEYMDKHPIPQFNSGNAPVTEAMYDRYQSQLSEYRRDMEFQVQVAERAYLNRPQGKEGESK
jgi:hypothetical protein